MNQLGQELQFTALGRRWKTARQKHSINREFVAWVKPQLGDPMARLKSVVKDLPESVALEAYRDAKKEAEEIEALDWNSPAVVRFRQTTAGIVYNLYLLLRPYQPDVTEQDAADIINEIGDDKLMEIFARAAGQDPDLIREAVKKKLAELAEKAAASIGT